eukprot:scaffold16426_cov109-Isochrysis_galbana.AAC.3
MNDSIFRGGVTRSQLLGSLRLATRCQRGPLGGWRLGARQRKNKEERGFGAAPLLWGSLSRFPHPHGLVRCAYFR